MTANTITTRLISRFIRVLGDKIASGKAGDNRICVLNYHRILEHLDPLLETEPDIATFRWQMQLISDCFNVLSLEQATHALQTKSVPPRAVCVTFDDGYRSNHDFALPILKEFGVPATIFVTTGHLEVGNMWNDSIIETVRRLPNGSIDLRDFNLGIYTFTSLEDRIYVANRIKDETKYLAPNLRSRVIQHIESLAGDLLPKGLMLSSEMIKTLSSQGVEIGGHTVSHPILTSLPDEQAAFEIQENKRQLEIITGKPLRFFAYPNGKPLIDFNEQHVNMVKNAGYIAAFTTSRGAAHSQMDPFQIPRGRPWDKTPLLFSLRILMWLSGRFV